MRLFFKFLWHLAALIGVVCLAVGAWFWRQGIEARDTPASLEISAARMARRTMLPAAARARQNPEPATSDIVRAGMEHWADHCASCHANDGSGATELGQGLFPRAPDMRQAQTQDLTDGELFYIIEHGVKLTGMPAWGTGTAVGEQSSWHLVRFIRRLPSLGEAEIAEMEELNPRPPAEWRAQEEERRFLSGEPPLPSSPPKPHH